ncbi:MAG: bifunctional oligoribonuclease/PAP phosphatase NrnA [Selenomonadales bacterium]|nr:bifunctional oligoribonuclease/PAP phosphatase NrnA [Selenomonadales bacterium]
MAVNSALLDTIIAQLSASRGVLLVGHVSADGDSLGSCLGLGHLLRGQGVNAHVVSVEKVPARYGFLPGVGAVITETKDFPTHWDVVVVMDCTDVRRTGFNESFLRREDHEEARGGVVLINIDHHQSNQGTLGTAWVDPRFAAVGQQVLTLAERAGWVVMPEAATCLYTALATDSGFFRHGNTSPTVLRDAAKLLDAGADLRLIVEYCLERKTLSELCLLREALSTLTQECDGRVTVMEIPFAVFSRCGVDDTEMEGMIDYARAVPGTQIAVLLRAVQAGITKVSLRSRGNCDVSVVAVSFGGGGHPNAAGCTLHLPISDVRAAVLAAVKQVLSCG